MKRSHIQLLAGTLLLILLGLGCEKSAPEKTATAAHPSAAAPASDTIARLHWLGKKRLAAETNAAGFMKIWNLPESVRLEDQTLDKLATAPWRLLGIEDRGLKMEEGTNTTVTAAAPSSTLDHSSSAQKLRPLLQDLVQEESYVEVHAATNGPVDLVLAIRLSADRARLWQTNLAAVLKSLGAKAGGGKAEIGKAEKRETGAELGNWKLGTWNITSTRSGDWTVVAFGSNDKAGSNNAKNVKNDGDATAFALQTIAARIEKTGRPFTASPTNYWVDLDVQLARVAEAFSTGWNLPTGLPQASLTMIGEGESVRTRGDLRFPRPLALQMEPWNIPTNLIDGNLTSFTAVRGIKPLLQSMKAWNELQIGPPPNQVYAWALQGMLMQTYFAAPLPNASNQVRQVTELVLRKGEQDFATNDLVKFENSLNFNGLEWKGVPFMSPFLRSITTPAGEFALGGGFPHAEITSRLPEKLLNLLASRPGMVGYDWEVTSVRSEQWLYISQFIRMVTRKPQMPGSSGLQWLMVTAPKLGICESDLSQSGPDDLVFNRKSTVGLAAIELQTLVDWLESPQFPLGLHTFTAQPEASQ